MYSAMHLCTDETHSRIDDRERQRFLCRIRIRFELVIFYAGLHYIAYINNAVKSEYHSAESMQRQ